MLKRLIKIFIIEDHFLVTECLKKLLLNNRSVEIIGSTTSGEKGLQLIKKNKPDIILMDLHLSGMNGIETSKKILHQFPDLAILIITACLNTAFAHKALQAGVKGYLHKTTSYKSMTLAIQSLIAGQYYIDRQISKDLAIKHLYQNESAVSSFKKLSKREHLVAKAIIQGKKAKKIAELLLINEKTVNSYRYRIFKKTGTNNNVELTRLAIAEEAFFAD